MLAIGIEYPLNIRIKMTTQESIEYAKRIVSDWTGDSATVFGVPLIEFTKEELINIATHFIRQVSWEMKRPCAHQELNS